MSKSLGNVVFPEDIISGISLEVQLQCGQFKEGMLNSRRVEVSNSQDRIVKKISQFKWRFFILELRRFSDNYYCFARLHASDSSMRIVMAVSTTITMN
jgi:hypothetical protein